MVLSILFRLCIKWVMNPTTRNVIAIDECGCCESVTQTVISVAIAEETTDMVYSAIEDEVQVDCR